MELGAGAAAAHLATVLLETPDHAGVSQQRQIVDQGGDVVGVLHPSQHLVVRQYLGTVRAGEFEETPQQGRAPHAGQREYVPRDGGFHDGVPDVAGQPLGLLDQWCGAGVAAVQNVLLKVPAEGVPHLSEAPVRHSQHFEAACEALEKPLWTSRGDDPRRNTCSSEPFRLSSSHSSLTASGQPSTFWISSRTRTAPRLFRARALAWFHCWEIQTEDCNTTRGSRRWRSGGAFRSVPGPGAPWWSFPPDAGRIRLG